MNGNHIAMTDRSEPPRAGLVSEGESLSVPFVDTLLRASVPLRPHQMGNDVYSNLKNNLIKRVKKRNFGKHGHIAGVYRVQGYENNVVCAEDRDASALYEVDFSCRLCKPMEGMRIVCRVETLSRVIVRLVHGPIYVIVTSDRLNEGVFFRDGERALRYRRDGKSTVLGAGDFVKVSLGPVSFNTGSTIICLGFLEDVASSDEVKEFYTAEDDPPSPSTDIE